MMDLLKQDLKGVVTKKRFVIMIALTFVAALVMTIVTKVKFWNDLTYFFAMQNFLFHGFNIAVGVALVISVYCRKYTKTSIEMIEAAGKSRAVGVRVRLFAGELILISIYVLMFGWMMLLGLIFGAHMTGDQIATLALGMAFDLIAAITSYSAALFFMYLFAFPVIPVIWYVLMMYVVAFLFRKFHMYNGAAHKPASFFIPKVTADAAYTQKLLSNSKIKYVVAFLVQLIIPFLLSMLVFKLKKKERKPRKKSETVEADQETEETENRPLSPPVSPPLVEDGE